MSGNEHDIQRRLTRALEATAHARVADDRALPPQPWGSTGAPVERRERRLWRIAIGVVAGATIVGGGIMAANSLRSTKTVPATPNTTSSIAFPPPLINGPGPVSVAGASFVLPKGWWAQHLPTESRGGDNWCLGRADTCLITVHRYKGNGREQPSDASSLLHRCRLSAGMAQQKATRESRTANFGGRDADFQRVTLYCPSDLPRTVAQYLVATPPAFLIELNTAVTGEKLTSLLQTVTTIAKTAKLPPASGGALRLFDQGHVVSATARGDGFDIVLRRYLGANVNDWVPTGVTARYHVPARALPPGYPVTQLGREVLQLTTDGTRVVKNVVIPGG